MIVTYVTYLMMLTPVAYLAVHAVGAVRRDLAVCNHI